MGDASLVPQGNFPAPPLQGRMEDASWLSPFNLPAPPLQAWMGDVSLAPQGALPAPPLQGGMGDASLTPQGDSPAPPSQVVTRITAPPADEQRKHQRFIPKPAKRKKQKLKRTKSSNYNYVLAREALGFEANAHHYQVYSAAVASSVTPDETPLVNNPMKEEVKFENRILKEDAATYKRKILMLELANKSSTRKAKRLKSQVRSLSDCLKIAKKKSRVAINQLLTVITMQHNELIAKFHVKIGDIQTEHDRALCKLQRGSRNKILNKQKSIERLLKQHNKQMTQLESDYQEGLTHMENQHNKSMVTSHDVFFCINWAVTTHIQPISVYYYFLYSAGTANDEDGCTKQYLWQE
jgi:hypothetical protein